MPGGIAPLGITIETPVSTLDKTPPETSNVPLAVATTFNYVKSTARRLFVYLGIIIIIVNNWNASLCISRFIFNSRIVSLLLRPRFERSRAKSLLERRLWISN